MRISGTMKAAGLIPTKFTFTNRVYKNTIVDKVRRIPSNIVALDLQLFEKVSHKFQHIWPIFLILGTESISLITMIMSAERVFAVHKPGIYKYYFTTKTKIGLVLTAIFVQMVIFV